MMHVNGCLVTACDPKNISPSHAKTILGPDFEFGWKVNCSLGIGVGLWPPRADTP
jgi:hypothetical protein